MRRILIVVRLLVAVATLCVGTAGRAGIVDFVLVQPLSSLTHQITLTGPALGGTVASVAQSPGSDTTNYYGHIYVDFQPGTIQLMPGSSMIAAVTGVYAPHDPVTSDPIGPPPVGADPGNYGLRVPAIQLFSNDYGLVLDNGAPGVGLPSTPVVIDGGGNFSLSGQAMQYTAGRQAFVSVIGNNTDDVIGFPTRFSTSSADVGNYNFGTQVLTIPVHSRVNFRFTNEFGGIDESYYMTGQLVAIPFVPEPSTFVLSALGITGLAYRLRRRR